MYQNDPVNPEAWGYKENIIRGSIEMMRKSVNNSVENAEESEPLKKKTNIVIDDGKEDIRESNEYGIKIVTCENFQSFLTVLHVGNSIVIYEITYENDFRGKDMEQDITLQLYISTFSCLYLIFMLIIRYNLLLKWYKSKRYIHSAETLVTTGFIWQMLTELVVTTIGPQIFLRNVKYTEHSYDYDVTIEYNLNDLLCCFVWVKLYVIVRTMLMSNQYGTPRAQRVCLLNGCHADLIFSIRSKFKDSPNTILIT